MYKLTIDNFQSLEHHICRFQYLDYNMHIYTIYCIEKRSFFLNYSGYESQTIFKRSPRMGTEYARINERKIAKHVLLDQYQGIFIDKW